ncbi:RCC1/BLIP-II [Meredithblackwellia eburnea MCA 4105]
MSNNLVDLHSLYATRSIAKARAFFNRTVPKSSGGGGGGGGGGGAGAGDGSYGSLGTSPSHSSFHPNSQGGILTAELNRRDHFGRTVLHLAASELGEWALDWVELLLGVNGLQVNAVDTESGWTALHRALYVGNIPAALLLLRHPSLDPRTKDHEGLSAYDVLNSTIEGTNPVLSPGELFTWGSNRNFVLGFSNDGDRLLPERVGMRKVEDPREKGVDKLEKVRVRDISMARLHTGIVTDEVRNNIRLCGYGTRGRLGPTTQTQFHFTPLPSFPHQVSSVTLSPDHTVVVTTSGDVYTFGLNRYAQLGYLIDSPSPSSPSSSPSPNINQAEPIQSTPRRVVGVLKKEVVLGAAASRTGTAVFTADSLFTWGTNRGHLGYPAAGSPTQVMPRKVTLSVINAGVGMLTMTESATGVLLASKEVVVLFNEGYTRITFPLARFPMKMQAYRPPQVSSTPNIEKISSCGNTFAALSSLGDVFTFSLESPTSSASSAFDSPSPSTTTSNFPRTTPKPQRIWSLRRNFTAVTDFGVGLDGAIILCTVSGHVFVRERRFEAGKVAPPSSSSASGGGWKFTRIPYLQRVVKVAANSTGAFAAIRADVPLRVIEVEGPGMAETLLRVLPHWRRGKEFVGLGDAGVAEKRREEGEEEEEESDGGVERDVGIVQRLMDVLREWDGSWEEHLAGTDAFVVVKEEHLRIPVHRLILSTRSPAFAGLLATSSSENAQLNFDCSPLTALLFIHYIYSDEIPALWDSRVAARLRDLVPTSQTLNIDIGQIKLELQSLATNFSFPALVESLNFHIKTPPTPTLISALNPLYQPASNNPPPSSDLILELADRTVHCHSVILRARCSFFETFYEDSEWLSLRKAEGQDSVTVDLKHLSWDVMQVVLEHLYRDAGVEMFDQISRPTTDDYVEFVTEIMAVANELLLDKLKLVCSAILRKFVTLHNVCAILVDAAFYEANDLVQACLHYLACSMETVLESRLLDDLPPDLVAAVAEFCRERQGARMPISRSGLLTQELLVKHGAWLSDLDVAKPTGGARKWRPIIPRSPGPSPSLLSPGPSPQLHPRGSPRLHPQSLSPNASPSLIPIRDPTEEPFAMDEDFSLEPASSSPQHLQPFSSPALSRRRQSGPQAQPPSPSAASFTPIGSPPPARLQPWTRVSTSSLNEYVHQPPTVFGPSS